MYGLPNQTCDCARAIATPVLLVGAANDALCRTRDDLIDNRDEFFEIIQSRADNQARHGPLYQPHAFAGWLRPAASRAARPQAQHVDHHGEQPRSGAGRPARGAAAQPHHAQGQPYRGRQGLLRSLPPDLGRYRAGRRHRQRIAVGAPRNATHPRRHAYGAICRARGGANSCPTYRSLKADLRMGEARSISSRRATTLPCA